MREAKNRRGFTLAEVLFASTISMLLVGGILSMFIVFSRLFRDGSEQLCLLSEARYGIERLSAGISAAEVLTVQPDGNKIAMTIPATTLRSAVNSTHTTIHVEGTSTLPPSGVVHIDEETIAYEGTDSKNLLSCTRGYNGTTASKHSNKEIVHLRLSYYLNGTTIYFNANGSPSTADDEPIVENVEPTGGGGIFRIPSAESRFRCSRVEFSFKCYNDINNNHHRETFEPGLDVAFEVFARNT
jgi:hypothetical protein